MDPRFRFCTSADGTRIAYATYGSGPPLLYTNTWVVSMDAQFTWPEARAYFDALAARTTLVMFDRRGSGASARDVDDLSPEAEACDVAAVADAAGIRDFALFADVATAACANYALDAPQRLRNLVLWFPTSDVRLDREIAQAFRNDWSYARRVWASRLYPQGPVSLQRAASRAIKETISSDMAARRFELPLPDLDALLARVLTPVLILQRESWARSETAQLAGAPRNCQLRFVPGFPPTPYPDHEQVADAVFECMDLGEAPPVSSGVPEDTAVILFADIADSTALTERLGDAPFRAKARSLDTTLRAAVRSHGGSVIDAKTLGDGILATFPAASQAIQAALSCSEAGAAEGLPLHAGLHAGDVLREADNVFGGAVNIAARVCVLSMPGEVLVSQTVRDLARTSAGVVFEDRGEQRLKGVEDTVRVFAVRRRG